MLLSLLLLACDADTTGQTATDSSTVGDTATPDNARTGTDADLAALVQELADQVATLQSDVDGLRADVADLQDASAGLTWEAFDGVCGEGEALVFDVTPGFIGFTLNRWEPVYEAWEVEDDDMEASHAEASRLTYECGGSLTEGNIIRAVFFYAS